MSSERKAYLIVRDAGSRSAVIAPCRVSALNAWAGKHAAEPAEGKVIDVYPVLYARSWDAPERNKPDLYKLAADAADEAEQVGKCVEVLERHLVESLRVQALRIKDLEARDKLREEEVADLRGEVSSGHVAADVKQRGDVLAQALGGRLGDIEEREQARDEAIERLERHNAATWSEIRAGEGRGDKTVEELQHRISILTGGHASLSRRLLALEGKPRRAAYEVREVLAKLVEAIEQGEPVEVDAVKRLAVQVLSDHPVSPPVAAPW